MQAKSQVNRLTRGSIDLEAAGRLVRLPDYYRMAARGECEPVDLVEQLGW